MYSLNQVKFDESSFPVPTRVTQFGDPSDLRYIPLSALQKV